MLKWGKDRASAVTSIEADHGGELPSPGSPGGNNYQRNFKAN